MRIPILILMACAMLTSCTPSAPKKAAEITAMEKSLDESAKKNVADTAKVKTLLADYDYYYTHFTKDSLAPVYLMRAADFYRAIGVTDKAIANYHRVYTEFPDYPKANFALFLEGFTYENDNHDLAKAKELYDTYLTKYPDSKMAKDVQFLLKNLGKTPEQIMAEIDSTKRATDSSAVVSK